MIFMNLREKILGTTDIKTQIINIPQWGVDLKVKGMTARQRAVLFDETTNTRGKIDLSKLYAMLALICVVDPVTDALVFESGDLDALAEKSCAAMELIADAAMKLSGLNKEEVEKNLEPIGSASSSIN